MPGTPIVLRGPAISFTGDPFRDGLERTMVHWPDAAIAIEDGKILRAGPALDVLATLPQGIAIEDYGPDSLLTAGFVDTHVHFPQTPMIASPGGQLLDWLERYTFPTELKFADLEFARDTARVFLQECLRNGVTTSCVYCTVHPHSVDALFEEAERLGLRIAAGKVLMDRNAPEALCDTAQTGYDQSAVMRRFDVISEICSTMIALGWGPYQNDHEDANGQYEVNFNFADALTTADRVTFFRMLSTEIAKKYGAIVTHMPKPFSDRTGSGLHVHFHLASTESGTTVVSLTA